MNNARIDLLLERIDEALVELAKITNSDHISAFIINGSVSIDDNTDINDPKFNYFRKRE